MTRKWDGCDPLFKRTNYSSSIWPIMILFIYDWHETHGVHSPVVNGMPKSPVIGDESARANEINPTVLSSTHTATIACTVKCHLDALCVCCRCGDGNASPLLLLSSLLLLLLRSHCRRFIVGAMAADVIEDTNIFSPTQLAAQLCENYVI